MKTAGRDPSEITCAYNVEVRVDERPDPEPGRSVVWGAPYAVAERLIGFTALGFTAMNVMAAGPDAPEQAERIATEVLPAVRDAVR